MKSLDPGTPNLVIILGCDLYCVLYPKSCVVWHRSPFPIGCNYYRMLAIASFGLLVFYGITQGSEGISNPPATIPAVRLVLIVQASS